MTPQRFSFDDYSPTVDNFLRKHIWRIIGIFIVMDALVILATPYSAIQGIIESSTGIHWFPYMYGSMAMVAGVTTLLHQERQVNQLAAFFFFSVHTLLLLLFSTIPSSLEILSSIINQSYDGSGVVGIAPLLKYTSLCIFIFLYEECGLLFDTSKTENDLSTQPSEEGNIE